jgi:coproporphyrinogen III oxidase-like Fe-S oxidoreductase
MQQFDMVHAPGLAAVGVHSTLSALPRRSATSCGSPAWTDLIGRIASADTLSLILQLPLCPQTCSHCCHGPRLHGTRSLQERLLEALGLELALAARAGAVRGDVMDVQFRGGAANAAGAAGLGPLVQAVRGQLHVPAGAPWSLAADPRLCSVEELAALHGLGFDTLQLGVVDLDPVVQASAGRLLSVALLDDVIRQAWRARWRQVQLDLTCGLPFQQPEGWRRTLQAVLRLGPTRIRCVAAHRNPERHAAQRALHRDAWPSPSGVAELREIAGSVLTAAGYRQASPHLWVLEDDPLLRDAADQAPASGAGATLAPGHHLELGPGARSVVCGTQARNEVDPLRYLEGLPRPAVQDDSRLLPPRPAAALH